MSFKSVISSALLICLLVSHQAVAGTDWNKKEIDWKTYEEAKRLASKEKLAVMLVFHSEGCGACKDYSKLFFDPVVVNTSQGMLMVIMDDGENEDISLRFAEDGSYVPRTYFLSPEGKVLPIRIGKPDDRFQYYLGTQGAAVLAEFMLKAQKLAAQ